MKNIYTITCHNVYNYGAILQEYALLKYLNSNGHRAVGIRYKPDRLSHHFSFTKVSSPRFNKNVFLRFSYIVMKFPQRLALLKRKRNFDHFEKSYIPLTANVFQNDSAMYEHDFGGDVYIAGSDQIWNPMYGNGNDQNFYLGFVTDSHAIKASYAASTSVESLPREHKNLIKPWLENLDFISLREESSLGELQDMGLHANHVLDPVFLLDRKSWVTLCQKVSKPRRYILIYDFDNCDRIKELAEYLSNRFDMPCIALSPRHDYVSKSYYLYGPQIFLDLMKDATYLVTNSYHGILFGIIFQREFFFIKRKEDLNIRILDLLNLLNMDNRDFSDKSPHDYQDRINYGVVEDRLVPHLDKSKSFLKEVCEHG